MLDTIQKVFEQQLHIKQQNLNDSFHVIWLVPQTAPRPPPSFIQAQLFEQSLSTK